MSGGGTVFIAPSPLHNAIFMKLALVDIEFVKEFSPSKVANAGFATDE
jgi:hypothetical protein